MVDLGLSGHWRVSFVGSCLDISMETLLKKTKRIRKSDKLKANKK